MINVARLDELTSVIYNELVITIYFYYKGEPTMVVCCTLSIDNYMTIAYVGRLEFTTRLIYCGVKNNRVMGE